MAVQPMLAFPLAVFVLPVLTGGHPDGRQFHLFLHSCDNADLKDHAQR